MKRLLCFLKQISLQTIALSTLGVFVALILTTSKSHSQEELQLDWQKSFSNSFGFFDSYSYDMEAYGGSAIVAGYKSTMNGPKMSVTRYDSIGGIQWEQMLSSKINAVLYSIAIDGDNIYLAGNSHTSYGDESNTIHYAKVSVEGELLWQYGLDTEEGDYDRVSQIEVVDGEIYAMGSGRGENGYTLGWVAKLDEQGSYQWKTAPDPGMRTYFSQLHVNEKGEIGVCGEAGSNYSPLQIVFDEKGKVVWQYPEVLSDTIPGSFLVLDSDSEGHWVAYAVESTSVPYAKEGVTYKFDSTGNKLWRKVIPNINYYGVEELGITDEGSVIVFANIEENYNRSVRITSYDELGNEEWSTKYSMDTSTYFIDGIIRPSGEVFMAVNTVNKRQFVEITSEGIIGNIREYERSAVTHLGSIAFDENRLIGLGSIYDIGLAQSLNRKTAIISLQSAGLEEVYFKTYASQPYSDVTIRNISSAGNDVWISNSSFHSDTSNLFAVRKMNDVGQLLWNREVVIPGDHSGISSYCFALDEAKNTISYYTSKPFSGLYKFDSNGNEVFREVLDSSNNQLAGALATDQSNNIYLGGYFRTSDSMFISKLDPNGHEIWTFQYQSPSSSPHALPIRMKVSNQGKLVVFAEHKNANDILNMYLFQLDLEGQLEWKKEVFNIPITLNSIKVNGFDIDSQGTITVAGTKYSVPIIGRFSSSGEKLWLISDLDGLPGSMATDDMGNTYLSCSGRNMFKFIKINPSGDIVDSLYHTFEEFPEFHGSMGIVFVENKLIGIGFLSSGVDWHPVEIILDGNLNLISGRVDTSTQAKFKGLVINDDNIIHAVYNQGTLNALNTDLHALVRQYSFSTLGFEDVIEKEIQIQCFPNPTRSDFQVALPMELHHIKNIALYDINGRMVREFGNEFNALGEHTISLSLPASLPPGAYILSISTSNALYGSQLIKN